jgi:formylglycine-generating enzyme required for sulfatase activity
VVENVPGVNITSSVSTELPGLELAQYGVTSNAEWTPYFQTFDGIEMVLVPAGCFRMGYSGNADDDLNELPVHEICFEEPYWIDRYEVTQRDFVRLGGQLGDGFQFLGDFLPAEQITWFAAFDFCQKRGGRLPAEPEWEYAARGPDALVFPWGNQFQEDNVVWNANSANRTAEVGSRANGVSWVGAHDMSGNVWEWTSSLYEPYPYDETDGREADTGPSNNVMRVLRGGSYNSSSPILTTYHREGYYPYGFGVGTTGFRCVRSY